MEFDDEPSEKSMEVDRRKYWATASFKSNFGALDVGF